jgi:uncharacterized phage protein gp47/JayE
MITVPTVVDLRDQIIADIEGVIGQSTPVLPKAFIRVLATALAGVLAQLYRFARWVYGQIFPATADDEALLRIGAQYGMGKRPSVAAILDIQIVGDDGTNVPASSIWMGNNGLTYSQTALAVIVGGLATARLTCLSGGVAGSLGVGNTLSLATAVSGVVGGSVTAIVTEGEDEETPEQFRARILQRMAGAPQGGAAPDYIAWAMQVPGIIKAFAFNSGAGAVNVYPLVATTGPARIPSASKLAEAQAYISNPARRPLCSTPTVAAMVEKVISITITGLSPADATTKAAITSALQKYFYAAYPQQYPDEPAPTNVLTVAAIWTAIFGAGATAASLIMSVAGTGQVTTYTLGNGEIATLGAITWA